MKKIWLVEFVGTLFIVFMGCGSIITAEMGLQSSLNAAVVFGVSVMAMIAAFGHISYAHFNPAVTVGFFILKRISLRQMFIYWSAEFSGAILASFFHYIIFGNHHSFGANIPHLAFTSAFLLEILGTSILMGVIAVVAAGEKYHKALPPISIGATVALISFVIGPLSGGSFNPARTFGPALFTQNLENISLYFLAPILGSILGAKVILRFRTNSV